jgi:hypothetical protein
MIKSMLIVGALVVLSACSGSTAQEASPYAGHFITDWAKEALWEQGTAEVAKYQAQRVIYQQPRNFEYTFILVKETFNEEFNVKTDDYKRDDLYDVMKVNKFARIPTDNYPYHYMTSLFFRRNRPGTLHKLVSTSQEWCGTTAKYFLNDGNRYTFGYNSYWDGQGVGETTVDGDMLFEDQLSYSLRALKFAEGLTFTARVAESQVSSKSSVPKVYEATFTINKATNFSLDTEYNVGDSPVWRVNVQLDQDKTNTYWFSGEYPNLMIRQSTWDGQELHLKSVEMDDYWVID